MQGIIVVMEEVDEMVHLVDRMVLGALDFGLVDVHGMHSCIS